MSGTALRLWIAASAFCILHSALLGCASAPARPTESSAKALAQLRSDLLAETQRPGVSRASWGIVVDSLDRHDRLVAMNPRTLFVPASIAKLVSVATAAEAVGWDYRFETTLLTTGSVSQGRLFGDLIVVGSGDPSIGGRGGGDLSALVAAVKAAGFERIEGRIVGDDDALEEPRPQLSWAWDDLGYTTGALFGALNLAENRTVATVTPGPAAGAPAVVSLDSRAEARPIINRVVTGPAGSPSLVWPEQRPGEPALTIAGSIPIGAPATQLGISTGNPDALVCERPAPPPDGRRHHRDRRGRGRGRPHASSGSIRGHDALHLPVADTCRDRASSAEGEHQPLWRGVHAPQRGQGDVPHQRRGARRAAKATDHVGTARWQLSARRWIRLVEERRDFS